jgi:hypothetical protein
MPIIPTRRSRRSSRAAAALVAALLLCLGLTSVPADAGPRTGAPLRAMSVGQLAATTGYTTNYPYNIQFQHSGKCIDVPGAVTTNVQLQQYTCVLQANEYWYLTPVSPDGYAFEISSGSSGKCMNIQGDTYLNGTAIIQYPCGSYGNEWFELFTNPASPGYYQIASFENINMCLNIAGASPYNGAKLQLYRCGDYPNENVHLN